MERERERRFSSSLESVSMVTYGIESRSGSLGQEQATKSTATTTTTTTTPSLPSKKIT